MDFQRLRNLTTGIIHTEIGHVYEDIELLSKAEGILTHQLPNAARALEPWLREKITDPRFWDGQFDLGHCGELDIEPMTDEEKAKFCDRFRALPSPFSKVRAQ
jgi:hypothetical protein